MHSIESVLHDNKVVKIPSFIMDMVSNEPEDDCLAALRNGDRDRYLTLLFLPPGRRADLAALAAFNLELAKIVDLAREPALGLVRLQWWRDSVDQVLAGGTARKHPVMSAIAPILGRQPAIGRLLSGMVTAREAELDPVCAPDLATFRAQADSGPGNLLRASVMVLAPDTDFDGLDVGIGRVAFAYAMAGRLRGAGRDARAGRLRLPLDALLAAGISPDQFLEWRPVPGLSRAVDSLIGEAEQELAAARRIQWPVSALPVPLTAGLARVYLRRLRARHCDLLDQRSIAGAPWDVWRLLWTRLTGRF